MSIYELDPTGLYWTGFICAPSPNSASAKDEWPLGSHRSLLRRPTQSWRRFAVEGENPETHELSISSETSKKFQLLPKPWSSEHKPRTPPPPPPLSKSSAATSNGSTIRSIRRAYTDDRIDGSNDGPPTPESSFVAAKLSSFYRPLPHHRSLP